MIGTWLCTEHFSLAWGCSALVPAVPRRLDLCPSQSAIAGRLAECTKDADCLPNLQERLTQFESPAGYWPKADSGVCSQWGIYEGDNEVQGLACECYVTGSADATTLVGPSGLICSNYGRRLDCIYRGSEFPGCDPADATSCTAVCVDVAARYAANARVTWETEIRLARCENLHCYRVYRIGDN